MSEQRTIELSKKMNDIDSVYNDLFKLGVREGDILIVHSSLSSLGWVCGGAQAVLMALKQAVGKSGTLVMPAHSGGISDPAEWRNPPVPKEWIEKIYESMPGFDVDLSPTRGMGCIAELFRTLPESIRSNHPQVSFSASGKYANVITDNHQLTPQFGRNTPLGKLYELNAKVLLLGVNYDSCTSFHLAEALNEKMPRKKMGTAIIENNKRVWKWFEDYAYDSDQDFEQIGKAFEETSNVTLGEIGNAECRLFNMKTGVDFAGEWLEKNRFHT
ncbi:aminoglycoside N(3)-acetyltransferase [Cohnella luojiensis]|uniref:Aminoglycoside N(3)-acetyltransferase n=1 Tax=Cohnella luojiensis TaxID=652876 RepID=A0A4Y8LTY4_9BACL|nr:AAC(3) family N-acetyltransferase [Cohnella luojiensis]TFE23067.1 AAC(3) family N-acetyltransferase [Cohnella luojiensis]